MVLDEVYRGRSVYGRMEVERQVSMVVLELVDDGGKKSMLVMMLEERQEGQCYSYMYMFVVGVVGLVVGFEKGL